MRFARRVPGWLAATAVYLALGVAMWWHVWSGHPTSTMVCDCGDPSSFVWFLAWPAYAISHGHSLFFTTWVHYPSGINLLDNTSVLALGVPLAPVTWLFGPVASLNVALTAAPVASALAAYGTLRRGLRLGWVTAFLGGLMFGFSPFVLRNEAVNHLQASFLALVPLIFWSCYELVVAQRGKWQWWGLLLGLLIAVQFFIGPEVLTVTAFTIGLALLLASLAALSHRGTLTAKLPFAARGLLLAGLVTAVLLAYPLWFAVAGPEHIQGPVWFHPHANRLLGVLFPIARTPAYQAGWPIAGYEGPLGVEEGYLGLPALAVLGIAAVMVRRPLTKLCAAVTLITVWLSLGALSVPLTQGGEPSFLPLPWRVFDHLPVLSKLAPANFSVPAVWFLVVAGALLLDQLLGSRRATARAGPRPGSAWARARVAPVVVSAALVIPWLFAWPLPYTTKTVTPPSWAVRDGAHLPAGSVVLFYPYPATYLDAALIWQANSGMRYAIVGGRGIAAAKDGSADHGFTPGTPDGTLSALTTPVAPQYRRKKLPPPPSPATIRSFRGVLRHWGVTNVVMTPGGRDPVYARRWLTAVLGAAPHQQDGAWVWDDVQALVTG